MLFFCVLNTHSVSSSQVDAEPSSPRTQQKHKDVRPAEREEVTQNEMISITTVIVHTLKSIMAQH